MIELIRALSQDKTGNTFFGFFLCVGAVCSCVMYVAYRISIAFQRYEPTIVVKCAKCGAEEEGEQE